MSGWEIVPGVEWPHVQRLAVPGGWIYEMRNMRPTQVFVPDPALAMPVQITEEDAYNKGYAAGLKDGKPDITAYTEQFDAGWQAAASASNTVQLDKASPNYEEGYNRGFSDALKGDKVKPLDTDNLVAVYVPRGVTTDDMWNIVKLLYEAEDHAEAGYAARCRAMAQKLEGK